MPAPYRERTYIFKADGCQLETTIVEKAGEPSHGSVILLHGISANKKIMSYMARGFAGEGLRVYVPDLPGHGRTPGPFSPARAELCTEALLRELEGRGLVSPERTILAGHSMGGAIAERVASRNPVAGLIAISPAPMKAAHGLTAEKLLFGDAPRLPANALLLAGTLEVESLRENAADLVAARGDGTSEYQEVRGASHASILFSSAMMKAAEDWAAKVLHFVPEEEVKPSHLPVVGALAGFVGIVLIAGPFLREASGKKKDALVAETGHGAGVAWLLAQVATGSVLAVLLLRFGIPLKAIRLFQGDYLASFLLVLGVLLLLANWKIVQRAVAEASWSVLGPAFASVVLLLLATTWFDLTFYEAWMTAARWARFPFLVLAMLPYHVGEEALLGPVEAGKGGRRLTLALTLRLLSWGALAGGIFLLHSGEILMVLLEVYMAIFNVIQRAGMDLVRWETGSAAAAGLFGAILCAGFCLVIFPLT